MAKSSSSQRLDFEAPIIELEKKIEELRTFAESTEVDLSGQILWSSVGLGQNSTLDKPLQSAEYVDDGVEARTRDGVRY